MMVPLPPPILLRPPDLRGKPDSYVAAQAIIWGCFAVAMAALLNWMGFDYYWNNRSDGDFVTTAIFWALGLAMLGCGGALLYAAFMIFRESRSA